MAIRQARRADTAVHRHLFAAARKAFVREGYERASLNAILLEAGVGKGSFFHFFKNKEDLFASVLEDALARVKAAAGLVELPTDARRFWVEGIAIIERWGMAAAAEPGFLRLLRALQPLRRKPSARLRRVAHEVDSVYRKLLERGIELGVVRSDLPIDTLVALTDAVDTVLDDGFHRQASPSASAIQAHRARVIETVQRLLRP